MILVELMGGLGNQMFQYAAGRALAERFQVPLKIDISWFAINQGDTQREYALYPFHIQGAIASKADRKAFIKTTNSCNRLWQLWSRYFGSEKNVFRENQFSFNPEFLQVKPPLYLKGYWQSERYFMDVADIIRTEFHVQSLSEASQRISEKIKDTTAVSLHVRRGDYVANPAAQQFHGCCSIDYYRRAIRYLQREFSQLHFFIFSDDLPWSRENLIIDAPVDYVEVNRGATPHEEIELMRTCTHHIIANSSFSWWGAWLNNKKEKIVIAPQRWFANRAIDTKDLIPQSWIRL